MPPATVTHRSVSLQHLSDNAQLAHGSSKPRNAKEPKRVGGGAYAEPGVECGCLARDIHRKRRRLLTGRWNFRERVVHVSRQADADHNTGQHRERLRLFAGGGVRCGVGHVEAVACPERGALGLVGHAVVGRDVGVVVDRARLDGSVPARRRVRQRLLAPVHLHAYTATQHSATTRPPPPPRTHTPLAAPC